MLSPFVPSTYSLATIAGRCGYRTRMERAAGVQIQGQSFGLKPFDYPRYLMDGGPAFISLPNVD